MLCFHWWPSETDREVKVDIVTTARDEKTWGLGCTWACNEDNRQITGDHVVDLCTAHGNHYVDLFT